MKTQGEHMADKLPMPDKVKFLEFWNRSETMLREAWKVRNVALDIYREHVPKEEK